MNDRRKFIVGCAAGIAALATPLGFCALDEGSNVSADTFRVMIGKGFNCMTELGYEVRLKLVDVWEGPDESGVEQFALLLKESGASGPPLLAEGIYEIYNRKLGGLAVYVTPSDTLERHYVTYFSLL